jgi:hypothetical protein
MSPLSQSIRQRRATVIGIIVVGLVAAFLLWNLLVPRSEPRLNAIRQHGYPVTLTELDLPQA